MKQTLKHIALLIWTLTFLSCGDRLLTKNIDMSGIIQIDAGIEEGENNAFDALIENVKFIPLEMSDGVLIGNIEKIIYYDSEYYIADNSPNGGINGIYRFDAKGKFLNKIGVRGRGPGEYVDPADFIVNSSGVVVLNHRQLLFYDHNGEYKKVETLEYILYEITCMQDENLIFAVAGDNRYHEEAKDYETLILDIEGNFISAKLPNKYCMNYTYSYKSFPYDNKIIYSKPFNKYVYSIDRNEIAVKYSIVLRDSPLPADYEEKCRGNYERFINDYRGKYNYFVGSLWENDDVVFFITQDIKRMRYWNVYNKRTQEVNTGLLSVMKIKPLNARGVILLGLRNCLTGHDGEIIGYLNAMDLSVDGFARDFPTLASVKEDDNPVIFHFQFRH